MIDKPILFSTEMVKAIIAGNKTQTRRVIKMNLEIETDKHDKNYFYVQDEYGDGHHLLEYCPYEIGQTLWIRETWYECINNNDRIYYHASEIPINTEQRTYKKRPSIFMFRNDARLFLKVKDIRIERVQDISDKDVLQEGFKMNNTSIFRFGYQGAFKILWDSINKKRGYGWDQNPYVWVYDFGVFK